MIYGNSINPEQGERNGPDDRNFFRSAVHLLGRARWFGMLGPVLLLFERQKVEGFGSRRASFGSMPAVNLDRCSGYVIVCLSPPHFVWRFLLENRSDKGRSDTILELTRWIPRGLS